MTARVCPVLHPTPPLSNHSLRDLWKKTPAHVFYVFYVMPAHKHTTRRNLEVEHMANDIQLSFTVARSLSLQLLRAQSEIYDASRTGDSRWIINDSLLFLFLAHAFVAAAAARFYSYTHLCIRQSISTLCTSVKIPFLSLSAAGKLRKNKTAWCLGPVIEFALASARSPCSSYSSTRLEFRRRRGHDDESPPLLYMLYNTLESTES